MAKGLDLRRSYSNKHTAANRGKRAHNLKSSQECLSGLRTQFAAMRDHGRVRAAPGLWRSSRSCKCGNRRKPQGGCRQGGASHYSEVGEPLGYFAHAAPQQPPLGACNIVLSPCGCDQRCAKRRVPVHFAQRWSGCCQAVVLAAVAPAAAL